jgi:hypothetical protein
LYKPPLVEDPSDEIAEAFEFGCADDQEGQGSQRHHHAGAAMFMRSTPGCGTSAHPSLELKSFQSQKQKESAEKPGPKHPGVLGRPGRPASVLLKENDMCIPGIYL